MNRQNKIYDPLLLVDHISLIPRSKPCNKEGEEATIKSISEILKNFKGELMVNGKEWSAIVENGK